MKKQKITALLLVASMVLGLAACGAEEVPAATAEPAATTEATTEEAAPAAEAVEEGTVFNIYAWNEEFKGFFEKYYEVPEGITVNWIINPSDNGVYQEKLDAALQAQADAAADEKVDMFLAEADYILKYVNSDYTQDITALGVTDFSNTYKYTVEACTDTNGTIKGVSFQCCPSALIYRRSIAEDVLGVSEPDEVAPLLDSWEKFEDVAAQAKEKGYYMTGSFAETYRPFSNNVTAPWVDADNNLQIDANIQAWIDQTDKMVENGYTLTAGIWDDEKAQNFFKDGKVMCVFGPAWYYNFCMGNAWDPDNGTIGDWAAIEGPMAHFWGGTWLLAPAGTDNPTMLADVMNTFINDEKAVSSLVEIEHQFSNNQAINAKFATDPAFGNELLAGQNDVALYVELAKNIKFQNQTIYDQLLNEGLQNQLQAYWRGGCTYDDAMGNFYNYVNETYPTIVTP